MGKMISFNPGPTVLTLGLMIPMVLILGPVTTGQAIMAITTILLPPMWQPTLMSTWRCVARMEWGTTVPPTVLLAVVSTTAPIMDHLSWGWGWEREEWAITMTLAIPDTTMDRKSKSKLE